MGLNNKTVGVLVFSAHYLPGYKGGGPIKTTSNLLAYTSKEVNYSLITKDRDLGDTEPYTTVQPGEWNEVRGTPVFYSKTGIKGLVQILKILVARNYDVVYLNSFFRPLLIFPLASCQALGSKGYSWSARRVVRRCFKP